MSHAKLRTPAGKLVGTYDVACTITDAHDHGDAWSICTTTARILHRGTLIATGLAELLHVTTSPGGFGVAPPKARFAIIGGTGAYGRARGAVTSTRTPSTRKLSHRGDYMGLSPTGKRVVYSEIFIFRFAEAQIAEIWGVVDVVAQLRQLGVLTGR